LTARGGGGATGRPAAGHHVVPSLAARGHLALTRDELVGWGEELGRAARPPLVITVSGELGAGKTTLIQAICRGYGVTTEVTSPTYAIVHEYDAPRSPVYHLDLFRLDSERDLTNIAWDEIVGAHALVLVEWPERATGALPPDPLHITLETLPADPDRRVLLAG
jgi:tRNA threonylcarbamoyladenosine biosynthesis protein TsaE